MYTYIYTCVYVNIQIYIGIHTYICRYIYRNLYTYIHICIFICIFICTSCTHTHDIWLKASWCLTTHTCVYLRVRFSLCVCVYVGLCVLECMFVCVRPCPRAWACAYYVWVRVCRFVCVLACVILYWSVLVGVGLYCFVWVYVLCSRCWSLLFCISLCAV